MKILCLMTLVAHKPRLIALLSLGLGLCCLLLLRSPSHEAPQPQSMEGYAQGTTYHIRYIGSASKSLASEVDSHLAAFDKVFSNYRPDSEITRFNAQRSLEWFSVSPPLVTLIERAKRISEQTQGLFDISLGALIKIWGFGPYKTAKRQVPSRQQIEAALQQSGYQHLFTRRSPPALRKARAGLLIDLSGIAQGFAVDTLADLFERRGIRAFMIEIGGETLSRGHKADGEDWTLAIETPEAEPGSIAQLLHPHGMALATSGDYRNYFEEAGRRYTHILDPRNGYPIQHKLASVSVLARNCTDADAFAKAFMIKGPEAAAEFAEQIKMPISMIIRQGDSFLISMAAGFEAYRIR